jgi:hypothetical protein
MEGGISMEKFFVTLYITSKIPGMVKVNNQILGDTESPVVASVSCSDIVYIEWHSIIENYASCFVKLEFDHGELVEAPVPPYCNLFIYEHNIFEVSILPRQIYYSSDVIPHIVSQRNYVFDKINYSASIYYDSGYVFCIENQYDFSIVFARYIDFNLADAVIDMHFIANTWFVCAHAKNSIIILKHSKSVELVYIGEGTLDFKDNALSVSTVFDDPAGRQKVIQYGIKNGVLGVRTYFTKMDLSKITSSEIAVHSFLYSIKNSIFDDALYFLDSSLNSQTSSEDLKNFFGDFEKIRTHLYQNRIKSPNICIALFRKISENLFIAKTYYFDINVVNDTYKIVNISE